MKITKIQRQYTELISYYTSKYLYSKNHNSNNFYKRKFKDGKPIPSINL